MNSQYYSKEITPFAKLHSSNSSEQHNQQIKQGFNPIANLINYDINTTSETCKEGARCRNLAPFLRSLVLLRIYFFSHPFMELVVVLVPEFIRRGGQSRRLATRGTINRWTERGRLVDRNYESRGSRSSATIVGHQGGSKQERPKWTRRSNERQRQKYTRGTNAHLFLPLYLALSCFGVPPQLYIYIPSSISLDIDSSHSPIAHGALYNNTRASRTRADRVVCAPLQSKA